MKIIRNILILIFFLTIILCVVFSLMNIYITSLASISTFLLAFIEFVIRPLYEKKIQRKESLKNLLTELSFNKNVLNDEKFSTVNGKYIVYDRLQLITIDAIITNGVFNNPKDKKLNKRLFSWREKGIQLHTRLAITESMTEGKDLNYCKQYQEHLAKGITLRQIKNALSDLVDCLLEDYNKESGIDQNTVFFPDED